MATEKSTKDGFERLPSNVKPEHYDLDLEPDLISFEFLGRLNVELTVLAESKCIILNAADLCIAKISWKDGSGSEALENLPFKLDSEKEILAIEFDPPLRPCKGFLTIEFTGTLNDKMRGFYRSKFFTSSGEEKYNAVTQFAATDARRAFPCWDEPAIKATFDVKLIVPKDKVALSNMPVKTVTDHTTKTDLLVYEFCRSPIMSTYLVAFVVGEFDYVEGVSSDGVLCRVYTPPGKKENGRFALDVTVRVLPFYKDYFGIAYPLPKMDLIAISDFVFGAMENWGLVTYRETRLLVDETQSSASVKQDVALVVGHEMAHQWFGNLVTMDWWTNLWLNEGYATFVEFLCVDHLFPEYEIWTQFVTETSHGAFKLDALASSHPIEIPINHPSEINEIFDAISYQKGASIIRMLHDFIGSVDFKRGMNIYLTRHQYGSATTEDLWKALEDASKKPVAAVMSTWTKQMGFPLLSVTEKAEGTGLKLTLTQEKYSIFPEPDKSHYKWLIPLTFSTIEDPSKIIASTVMDGTCIEVNIPNVSGSNGIKVNPGQVGFYRVSYAPEMLSKLVPAIQNKTLPPLDRLGVLDDLFALVQSGKKSTVEALQLLEAYRDEDNCTVWTTVCSILSRLQFIFDGTPIMEEFKGFARSIFAKISPGISWDAKSGESHLETLMRSVVLERLVSLEDAAVIGEAKKRFTGYVNGSDSLVADLRKAAYRAVLSTGDEDTYQQLLELYRKADAQEEKDRIGRSLGAAKDTNILRQVLEFAISDDVRSQDTIFIVASASISHAGRELTWNFFKDKFELFKSKYLGGPLASRLLKAVLENFNSMDKYAEIMSFFSNNPFPGTEMAVKQACESIQGNVAWLQRDQEQVMQFLKKSKCT